MDNARELTFEQWKAEAEPQIKKIRAGVETQMAGTIEDLQELAENFNTYYGQINELRADALTYELLKGKLIKDEIIKFDPKVSLARVKLEIEQGTISEKEMVERLRGLQGQISRKIDIARTFIKTERDRIQK